MPEAAVEVGEVGVLLVGHGESASALLRAARQITGPEQLAGVEALDAGAGVTPELEARIRARVDALDRGRGVLLIADLLGSSPCSCGQRELLHHPGSVLVTGLSLAMLCKLGNLMMADETPENSHELAEALADAANRSITVRDMPDPGPPGPPGSAGEVPTPPAGGAAPGPGSPA